MKRFVIERFSTVATPAGGNLDNTIDRSRRDRSVDSSLRTLKIVIETHRHTDYEQKRTRKGKRRRRPRRRAAAGEKYAKTSSSCIRSDLSAGVR